MDLVELHRAFRDQDIEALIRCLSRSNRGRDADAIIRLALLTLAPRDRDALRGRVSTWLRACVSGELQAPIDHSRRQVMLWFASHLDGLVPLDQIPPSPQETNPAASPDQ